MFQFRPSMQWGCRCAYPWNMGYVARERIPIRHYPHRDPLSLQTRLILRNHLFLLSQENWSHWAIKDWRHYIADEKKPDIFYWAKDAELPDLHCEDHIHGPMIRAAQWIAHRMFLPILDFSRPRFPAAFPDCYSCRDEPGSDTRSIGDEGRGAQFFATLTLWVRIILFP